MDRSTAMNYENITVVITTYGERQRFVKPVLQQIVSQGITNIILVNNGATWNISLLKTEIINASINIIEIGCNKGSAQGISEGINQARKDKENLIWLLDDDNYPDADCLSELLDMYNKTRKLLPKDHFAVLAFRPRFHSALKNKKYFFSGKFRAGTFFGFRTQDIPSKLLKYLPTLSKFSKNLSQDFIDLPFAPYGGLMFHSSLIDVIGLPNKELILYEDDTEFTWRITQTGGKIRLAKKSILLDIDKGWNEITTQKSSILGWYQEGNDFRAYYRARNLAWFETYCMRPNKFVYLFNKIIYLTLLFFIAVKKHRLDRFRLLLSAVRDGENGNLGENINFPLPQ